VGWNHREGGTAESGGVYSSCRLTDSERALLLRVREAQGKAP
jgi:hypothetical protein